ncbi:MAG: hypothetical protein US68_C0032G0002 [Candidatus Shapirobacteria bacterium GW2011_GWE1_38_10]|uniref:Uncharacterized protein n=1 Tax=Candidatus Shapirobacteria bacterium GW2011_GWE1_38_10 TaxID=1618488 RepID=A0A0G0L701_9BACT|nr:MAG: hypothetical protein US68_C0032G0002 [Candidatus Shapirobacteria bacterium GW2011_GWE1_38_10]
MRPSKVTILVTVLLLPFTFYLLSSKSLAQAVITSPNYKVQMPNFNSGAGIPSSSGYKLDTTIGQTGAGLYTSTGYLVRSGFQYIHSIIPFSFSMSNYLINFGTLIPGTPSELTSTLTVSSGGAGGYRVTARENNALKTSDGQEIPDVTCDGADCSEATAGVWSLATTYGFGYNMTGNDIPADFTDNTYYRHFANSSLGQSDQVVMSNTKVGRSRVSTITYKINVSGVQAAGSYQNMILFTAIPSF